MVTVQESTERVALELAVRFEESRGRTVTYVGDGWPRALLQEVGAWVNDLVPNAPRVSCDLVSRAKDGQLARLVEVKGRRGSSTSVSVIDRQRHTANTLGASWWLYVAFDCGTPQPFLVVVEEPRRLPWKLLTPPRVVEPGTHTRVQDEGLWHVMPSDIISLGERVEVRMESS